MNVRSMITHLQHNTSSIYIANADIQIHSEVLAHWFAKCTIHVTERKITSYLMAICFELAKKGFS